MKFFNSREDIEKTFHKLPHWKQDEVAIFITFRLADSLPREVVDAWFADRDKFFVVNPKPWDAETETLFHELFSKRMEDHLDDALGCCALSDPETGQIVAERLHHFDGIRYRLWSYVIMPNHLHVLVTMNDLQSLANIIKGWKGVSSRLIQKSGLCEMVPFWQPDYFDRLVRSGTHFETIKTYIRENPIKAGLSSGFLLWERTDDEDVDAK